MNKYQNALDLLFNLYEFEDCHQFPDGECLGVEYRNEFEALQELIDKYKRLEKALDIACIKLEKLDKCYAESLNVGIKNTWSRRIVIIPRSAEKWKDWLLDYAEDRK